MNIHIKTVIHGKHRRKSKSPTVAQPTQDRDPTEDTKECLKESTTAVTEEITHSMYYQHTPSTLNTQSPSPWQHSKLLATGYWPPTAAPPPVVDMFFRPTLRQHQHMQSLPQSNSSTQASGPTGWSGYEEACQHNPTPYQTEFYSDTSATYGFQPIGNGSNQQWDSQGCNMRSEDVVVSGRFQLQLEVQARIRRGEIGTTASSGPANTPSGSGGYLPNGPNYGITSYNRNIPGYVEQQYRIEDGQFVGN